MVPVGVYMFAGLAGGLLRALVGLIKSKTFQEKKWQYKPFYFWMTVLTAGIIGMIAGLVVESSWKIAFLAGYAGTDFFESMFALKHFLGK